MREYQLETDLKDKIEKQETKKLLASCQSYQEFLAEFLRSQKISYSLFARRAGFRSRSFPRDIVLGKRTLTPRSLASFLSGFRFNALDKNYVQLLVCQSEASIRKALGIDEVTLQDQLSVARDKFLQVQSKTRKSSLNKNNRLLINELLKEPLLIFAYAALGTPDSVSTSHQICERLKKSQEDVDCLIKKLCKIGLCKEENGGFIPVSWHECFRDAGESSYFSQFFRAACSRGASRVVHHGSSSEELFFSSALLVNSSQLHELKEKLRALITAFIDDSISQEGQVVEICCSFHKIEQ